MLDLPKAPVVAYIELNMQVTEFYPLFNDGHSSNITWKWKNSLITAKQSIAYLYEEDF